MRILLYSFSLLLLSLSIRAQTAEEKRLEKELFDLPDVSFTKISKPEDPFLKYMLKVKQPIDHHNAAKGYFYQRVILTHHGFDRPTVMQTQGYELYLGKNELEAILNANHLNIEHRFFGESRQDSLQWNYLNLEQATDDLHHINQLFKQLYKNKWVSTGISKGGQTTIFYKYFYPNDVDLSVAYVAPFSKGIEDKRIYRFLDSVGTAECRKKLFDLQIQLLQNEEEALAKLKWFAKGADMTFTYLDNSLAKAYELAVLEFTFSFWQWGGHCEEIPQNQPLDSALQYLLKISSIEFLSDASMNKLAPHYYQAATQMGYYGYDITPFKKYIRHFTTNPLASFYPKEAGAVKYDNSLNEKVDAFLKEKGNNILYIYGGNDTWSADRIIPSAKVNSKAFVLPGKDHGKARIKNMEPNMKADFEKQVESILGLKPDLSKLQ